MEVEFSCLVGRTIKHIVQREKIELYFLTENDTFKMHHNQECCEAVEIEDIVGDLNDLIDSPILQAEVVSKRGETPDKNDTGTWTFYKIATIKGYVTIRWLGVSNGYYSEEVSFCDVIQKETPYGVKLNSLVTERFHNPNKVPSINQSSFVSSGVCIVNPDNDTRLRMLTGLTIEISSHSYRNKCTYEYDFIEKKTIYI